MGMTGTFALPDKQTQNLTLGGPQMVRRNDPSKISTNILEGQRPGTLLSDIASAEKLAKGHADASRPGAKNRMTYMSRLGISSKRSYY